MRESGTRSHVPQARVSNTTHVRGTDSPQMTDDPLDLARC